MWGGYGGRVYTTALGAMCLEVYYRYAPDDEPGIARRTTGKPCRRGDDVGPAPSVTLRSAEGSACTSTVIDAVTRRKILGGPQMTIAADFAGESPVPAV